MIGIVEITPETTDKKTGLCCSDFASVVLRAKQRKAATGWDINRFWITERISSIYQYEKDFCKTFAAPLSASF